MKFISSLACLLFLLPCVSLAAPRLVVSTPSLLPGSEIDFVFDQPMVGQEDLGKETENKFVTIKPALAGKLFWKAPSIAGFHPDGILAIGTEYHFSVEKGMKHLDRTAVEAGEFAKLSSDAFHIHTAQIRNRYSDD
jgi:hypothetical protein